MSEEGKAGGEIPDGERWREIPGFEGLYEVSDRGRVRRLFQRYYMCKRPLAEPLIVTSKASGKGGSYRAVKLARDGDGAQRRYHYVHRLVLLAFVGPPPRAEMDAAHQDGDRTNNALSNLAWKTRSENHADKKLHGTHTFGETSPVAKLTDEAVRAIRSSDESATTLARRFGVSRGAVRLARLSITWGHVK